MRHLDTPILMIVFLLLSLKLFLQSNHMTQAYFSDQNTPRKQALNATKQAWLKVYHAIDEIIANDIITFSDEEKDQHKYEKIAEISMITEEFRKNTEQISSEEKVCRIMKEYGEPLSDIVDSIHPHHRQFIQMISQLCDADMSLAKYKALIKPDHTALN